MGSLSPALSLAEQLHQAHENFTKVNTQSHKHYAEACNYLPGGNTRTVLHAMPFPLVIDSADGTTLTSLDGHTYLDLLGEYTAGVYGHNHPVIKESIQKALEGGWNYGANSRLQTEFAKIICERFPAMDLVRFVNSGTEANMMALATAVAVTGKQKILIFNKGYHGSTISGRTPSVKKSVNLPHDFVLGTYNDVSGTEKLVNSLPPDTLAAILVEPVLGSGGCYEGSDEFLSTLRQLATAHNAVLIFDEVMTSRLSYHGFGAAKGITPDLMTVGKYLGGGMSFGAFGGKEEIMRLYDPRDGSLEHPGTFNNNVFTMSAGISGCTLFDEAAVSALNALGDKLATEIESLLQKADIITQDATIPTTPIVDDALHVSSHPQRPPKMFVKHVGSLIVVHFAGPDREVLQALFYHFLLDQGIYIASRGFMALTIMTTEEHVRLFVEAVGKFVKKFEADLRW